MLKSLLCRTLEKTNLIFSWFKRKAPTMTTLDEIFAPPECVRGMTSLDKPVFERRVVGIPAVRVNQKLCLQFRKRLNHVLLRYHGVKNVVKLPETEGDLLIRLIPEHCKSFALTEDDKQWVADNGGHFITDDVVLSYEDYTMKAVLTAILPEGIEVPKAYELIGHIIHINLRTGHEPYKKIIGEVMLDKHKNAGIRTVVNKSGIIEETFRFFKMEILAGEDKMETIVLSNGCSFSFDFSKVYWNSRLEKEHSRIIHLLKQKDVVLDMFAGVGPFAIPACKKGCTVYANDLNPHSYSALSDNAKLNKVGANLKAYNLDAREFLTKVTNELVSELIKSSTTDSVTQPSPAAPRLISHVIMNLPASAVEFLDSFRGVMSNVPQHLRESLELPYVHCYHFTTSDSPETDSLAEVEHHLGVQLSAGSYTVSNVRDVSPNKLMMRVSFKLPSEVAYDDGNECPVFISLQDDQEPAAKRIHLAQQHT